MIRPTRFGIAETPLFNRLVLPDPIAADWVQLKRLHGARHPGMGASSSRLLRWPPRPV
jgi:hypothetical protein